MASVPSPSFVMPFNISSAEQFNRQAVHYDEQWNKWSEENLRWMLQEAQPQLSHNVLDIGTGTGFTALAFAPHVKSVVGLDVSSGMLDQARVRAGNVPNARFEQGSAEQIPFPGGSFDLVTCRICAHHFNSVPDFLRETRRVLVPGGRLILADTAVPDDAADQGEWQNRVELMRDPSHIQNYSPLMWLSFLAEARLRIEELSFSGGRLPITMEDWLTKSGCEGDQAGQVREEFRQASPSIQRDFHIEPMANGDMQFAWMRVCLSAQKGL